MSGSDVPSGFAEAASAYEAGSDRRPQVPFKVTVGPGGRIVIPAEVRRALGIEEGTVLFTRLDGDEWHVMTAEASIRRAQAIAARYKKPGVDEVAEFLAQRRAMWGEE